MGSKKSRLSLVVMSVLLTLLGMISTTANADYQGSSVDDIWEQVRSDPYHTLPQRRVTLWSFFSGFKDRLLESSKRTLSDERDILPTFRKLLHPNGICLRGSWNITEPNQYTGVFADGSSMPIIARASTALTNTKAGQNRAFGIAGKIFPVSDGDTTEIVKTANFFTIEDLGGNYKKHFLDAENSNDIIKISPTLTVFMNSLVGLVAGKDFTLADKSTPLTSLIRELYPLSEATLEDPSQAITPTWLKITGAQNVPRVDALDFRDELNVENYPEGLFFDILVANEGIRLGEKQWQKIGYIQFDESVVSESCDTRLHFTHPKSRTVYLGPLQFER